MIRLFTFACALAAAAWSYLSYAPAVDALERRIADAQGTLRSDDVAFAQAPLFERERSRLQRRYARLFDLDPQAAFVRDLGSAVDRHGIALVAVDATGDSAPETIADGVSGDLPEVHLRIELRGSYRRMLSTVAGLSTGSALAKVDACALRRDGGAVVASVPVTLYAVPKR